jgi:hypothetical protein
VTKNSRETAAPATEPLLGEEEEEEEKRPETAGAP